MEIKIGFAVSGGSFSFQFYKSANLSKSQFYCSNANIEKWFSSKREKIIKLYFASNNLTDIVST